MSNLMQFMLRNGTCIGRFARLRPRRLTLTVLSRSTSCSCHYRLPRHGAEVSSNTLPRSKSGWRLETTQLYIRNTRSFSTKSKGRIANEVEPENHENRTSPPSLIAELLFAEKSSETRDHLHDSENHTSYSDFAEDSQHVLSSSSLAEDLDYDSADDSQWEKDREQLTDSEDDAEEDELFSDISDVKSLHGTPDPTIPMSEVPCSGCGAYLHCHDPGYPGYMHSEKFMVIEEKKLQRYTCNRCMVMRIHKVALNVAVTPDQYVDIIAKVKDEKALLVLLVDILDINNSIPPNLTDIVGRDRPVFVVGNKIDLLPKDDKDYLMRAKDTLRNACIEANVKEKDIRHIALVSAKSKYGVEELVTKLMSEWARKGHVYILGCTNVGKSSLFNALLSSDYSKSTARDLINRATICSWPGTTLNLLRFPIVNPDPEMRKARYDRLVKSMRENYEAEVERQKKYSQTRKLQYASLKGDIALTKVARPETLPAGLGDVDASTYTFDQKFGTVNESGISFEKLPDVLFDESQYADSRWCYDTPGLVNPDQIINKLTQEELNMVLADKLIRPRSFVLKPGQVMFVSGLARIDYVQGSASLYLTVVTSNKLPIEVVDGEQADDFYQESLANRTLKLPVNDPDRLSKLPNLEGHTIDVKGIGWKRSAVDILLSSIGWAAVTLGRGMEAQLRAYTPGGVGCRVREPPLLPYAINLRGKRIRGSAAYQHKKVIP